MSMTATHSYKCLFMHWLSYKQLECNKFLPGSVIRYTTPALRMSVCFGVVTLIFKIIEVTKVKFGFWSITQKVLDL